MPKKTKKTKQVIVGGTFDVLHKGHQSFLKKAFGLGEVTIGLTSDRMAEIRKKRKVESFEKRKKELESFIKKQFSGQCRIIKIEDKFGPTMEKDFDYIVVSSETYQTALLINKKRRKIKKKPIKIVKIKFILADDGKPINALRVLKGKIDKQGKLL